MNVWPNPTTPPPGGHRDAVLRLRGRGVPRAGGAEPHGPPPCHRAARRPPLLLRGLLGFPPVVASAQCVVHIHCLSQLPSLAATLHHRWLVLEPDYQHSCKREPSKQTEALGGGCCQTMIIIISSHIVKHMMVQCKVQSSHHVIPTTHNVSAKEVCK